MVKLNIIEFNEGHNSFVFIDRHEIHIQYK